MTPGWEDNVLCLSMEVGYGKQRGKKYKSAVGGTEEERILSTRG